MSAEFNMGPIQVIGDVPTRQNLPVEQDSGVLNWKCHERLGCPVVPWDTAVAVNLAGDKNYLSAIAQHKMGLKDLVVGMDLACMSLFGVCKATVTEIYGIKGYAYSGHMLFPLEYEEGEQTWINMGSMNTRGLTHMTFNTEA